MLPCETLRAVVHALAESKTSDPSVELKGVGTPLAKPKSSASTTTATCGAAVNETLAFEADENKIVVRASVDVPVL